MYFVRYHTGAGDETAETLDKAMSKADDGASYTQKSITIEDADGREIASRQWYGSQASEEDEEEGIIKFGPFGFYGPWIIG